ncbi:VOC family protein [Agrobacterium rosae]|uniref:Ring-cleaving dioxygenase n=1 Tax=Agrobacterium rosae TaxID=1972867 RepID=A0AAE5RYD0_9HYPH|nr:VOC family protein [Agrobacterium rosae]KAA3514661.1 ring-cleaving dioxygenase [Agrobacterium rosae]KAA3523329.1 ring-cleaving dioxygenase [Agrobacterium rosae]MCM2433521.1 ring-cleaving dioxygenase [Agrobacterium rosae]MDX8329925.1 VOC family protein [Agrobacterium rosae]MQB47886.1 ring-cleaving dioxygenase [Agrobacterium rosae]
MTSALGIHHITMITRKVQANVDFYVGFLGLRLVKRTAGFEDAMQLHLLYGDHAASPGSLLTFLVWEDGAQGRVGYGQTLEVSLAIDPASIGFWLTRGLSAGIRTEGPMEEFGEPVIRLKDPDGIILKLVGTHAFPEATPHEAPGIPLEHAIRRIRGATMLSEVPEETENFLAKHFGYISVSQHGSIRRTVSASGDIIDVRDATGFWSSAPGTGTVDHIAFRAADMDDLNETLQGLKSLNSSPTNAHDRKYFHSLYVREPGDVLIEMATDGPGMTVDEPFETMGEQLFIPPLFMRDEEDVRVALPQFSLPGEERVIYRDLPFVHRFYTPKEPDGSTIILLHGSGGSETSLMALAHTANPHATLLGVRGRSTEEGIARWFRRFADSTFDQKDIVSEAEAFAVFMERAMQAYGIDKSKLSFIGHSNGANFLAAFFALHPQFAADALLLRPMPVLDHWPETDLSATRLTLAAGETDRYRDKVEALKQHLIGAGAEAEVALVPHGHELGLDDVELAKRWANALPTTGLA